jgi:Lon protease-like protein
MPHTLTIDFNKPIALFPLPGCVLLPHSALPLHIFEPRYRAMTCDALDSTGLIAMATIDGDLLDIDGRPVLKPCVCVGYIVHHERLDDGRYNILLQGIARARLLDEIDEDPGGYRRAQLAPIDAGVMEIDLQEHRAQLTELLKDDALQKLAGIGAIRNWMTPELPTAAVTDLSWHALSRDPAERYRVLSEPCAVRRASRLVGLLRRTRDTLRVADGMGPCTGEHGLPLN